MSFSFGSLLLIFSSSQKPTPQITSRKSKLSRWLIEGVVVTRFTLCNSCFMYWQIYPVKRPSQKHWMDGFFYFLVASKWGLLLPSDLLGVFWWLLS